MCAKEISLTIEDAVNIYIESREIVNNLVNKILTKYCKLKYNTSGANVRYFKIDNTEDFLVAIYWEINWSNGGYDHDLLTVPLNIFCGDWEEWLDDKIKKEGTSHELI